MADKAIHARGLPRTVAGKTGLARDTDVWYRLTDDTKSLVNEKRGSQLFDCEINKELCI
jgi:hypothetical protein